MADNETIAYIIAEMRNRAKRPDFVSQDVLKSCADRFEAAHKRERETADAKIADLQSRVKLWTDRSAELVKKCDEQYAKLKQVGNAAKLRVAADTRFDICKDIALVLKIGRDYQNKDGYRGAHYDTVKLLCDAIEYQQEQLKTKTEVGDCAKLREALINVVKRLEAYVGCDHHTFHPTATTCDGITSIGKCGKIATCAAIFKARAALAAPARNCDALSAQEQTEKFNQFCQSHRNSDLPKCAGCPLEDIPDGTGCAQAWAQMPYEEGGNK